jgi:hypothetical protein
LWKPDKLARQVAFLDKNPDVGLVHSPAELVGIDSLPTGKVIGANNPEWREGNVFEHAVRRCVVKSPTPVMRRSVFERVGGFNTQLHYGEDWEFWARAAYVTKFGYIADPLAYYRVHNGSSAGETAVVVKELVKTAIFMAGTLSRFVRAQDRPIVLRQCCLAYLELINANAGSCDNARLAPLGRALRLWPACLLRREFWAIVKKGTRPNLWRSRG